MRVREPAVLLINTVSALAHLRMMEVSSTVPAPVLDRKVPAVTEQFNLVIVTVLLCPAVVVKTVTSSLNWGLVLICVSAPSPVIVRESETGALRVVALGEPSLSRVKCLRLAECVESA